MADFCLFVCLNGSRLGGRKVGIPSLGIYLRSRACRSIRFKHTSTLANSCKYFYFLGHLNPNTSWHLCGNTIDVQNQVDWPFVCYWGTLFTLIWNHGSIALKYGEDFLKPLDWLPYFRPFSDFIFIGLQSPTQTLQNVATLI